MSESPFPEGTFVCLKTGGPMMTVEDIMGGSPDGMVAAVWMVAGVVHRDAFHKDHLNSFIRGVPERFSSMLQDDLRDMCRALGLPDGARPESPHEVFRECIAKVALYRSTVEEQRALLKPFADFAAKVAVDHPGWDHDEFKFEDGLTMKVFRAAHAAYQRLGGE